MILRSLAIIVALLLTFPVWTFLSVVVFGYKGGFDGFAFVLATASIACTGSAGFALTVGYLLRDRAVGRHWRSSRLWALLTAALGLIVMGLGLLGVSRLEVDTHYSLELLLAMVMGIGSMSLAFAIVNWPCPVGPSTTAR